MNIINPIQKHPYMDNTAITLPVYFSAVDIDLFEGYIVDYGTTHHTQLYGNTLQHRSY